MSEYRLNSIESEQGVIGALLMRPDASDRLGGLRPDHCYTDAHRIILGQILGMIAEGQPVDVLTVSDALQARGLNDVTGGLAYLGELVQNTPSAANIHRYAKQIIDKALERQLLDAGESISSLAQGVGTTTEKLANAQSLVMKITESVASKAPRTMREVLLSAAGVLSDRQSGGFRYVPTGFADIDRILSGGLRPGNVIVLAGRPAMGKTSLAVNIGYRTATGGTTSLILSMEMPEQELADRLIAQAGGVALDEVLAGNMEGETGERIMTAVSSMQDIPLIIDDQGGLNLFDVASKARSVKRKHGLGLLVVDYLQLMSGKGDNREQEIGGISRGFKSLAKELEVPIILLSQLSRDCEKRQDKRPMSSDLRDSGAIEQDADVILFVYRDQVYYPESPDKGTAEIICTKNRQGATGMVRMAYQGQYTRFMDIAPGWMPEQREQPMKKQRRGFDG